MAALCAKQPSNYCRALRLKITVWEKFRALFAKNKKGYWFDLYTDEEKELKRMDVWQLAQVIRDESISTGNKERKLVADHMLKVRLARIQSSATYISAVFGLIGVIIGAVITVFARCG